MDKITLGSNFVTVHDVPRKKILLSIVHLRTREKRFSL